MNRRSLCQAEHSRLFVIDIQEKLAGVMPQDVLHQVVRSSRILLTAAAKLSIPVTCSEQYPRGLGATLPELQVELDACAAEKNRIEKTCFSGCAAQGMAQVMADAQHEQWILLGMEAHICVTQTCMELLQHDRQVFVVQDAVCSRDKRNYKNAIARMRDAGAVITNTESVLFEWLRDATHPLFRELSQLIR